MNEQNMSPDNKGVPYVPQPKPSSGYAGFWRRLIAYILDVVILGLVLSALGLVFQPLGVSTFAIPGGDEVQVFAYLITVIISWLYFAGLESSAKQATIGKMVLGVKIADSAGQRISFGRATGRYFAKFVSAAILFIGFLMIGFHSKKQGLHDIIVGTLAVRQ